MAEGFYVSVENNRGSVIPMSGPYVTHAQALDRVKEISRKVALVDAQVDFLAWGTMKVTGNLFPGRLDEKRGIQAHLDEPCRDVPKGLKAFRVMLNARSHGLSAYEVHAVDAVVAWPLLEAMGGVPGTLTFADRRNLSFWDGEVWKPVPLPNIARIRLTANNVVRARLRKFGPNGTRGHMARFMAHSVCEKLALDARMLDDDVLPLIEAAMDEQCPDWRKV